VAQGNEANEEADDDADEEYCDAAEPGTTADLGDAVEAVADNISLMSLCISTDSEL
jgi:hypothetical protein